jgi:hypothetical protein
VEILGIRVPDLRPIHVRGEEVEVGFSGGKLGFRADFGFPGGKLAKRF